MASIRPPAVAGMFYPDNPRVLRDMISKYISEAEQTEPAPKAIIAPHAGYIYSGPVAASAYARLKKAKDQISRVVLLGPSHRVPLIGLAATSADQFKTPLGTVEIDKQAIDSIKHLSQVRIMDEAHAMEHSLEVHIPFLQMILDDFTLIPLVVGEASPDQVSEVIDLLWGGPETLIVISSDLSHYHDYETARKMDSRTSKAIESMRPQDINYDDACGRNPVNGLLLAAKEHNLHAKLIDLRNSGDTAGPRDQVVGYGAYVFE
jgi:AmmeMemoRadiSam system protein B